jgi:hypothetical protein
MSSLKLLHVITNKALVKELLDKIKSEHWQKLKHTKIY